MLHNLHYFRRNDRRAARLRPPNQQKWEAAGSAKSAEMTQVQRMTAVCPPRTDLSVVAAGGWEKIAENVEASAKPIEPQRR